MTIPFCPYFFMCMSMFSRMGGYPQAYPTGPYPAAYGQPYPYPQQRKRMSPAAITLIVVLVLALIGGGITAAVLLTGGSSSSYKLGDAKVEGGDIQLSDMVLKQENNQVVLSGSYSNATGRSGDAYITVKAILEGEEQIITFTVDIEADTDKTFSDRRTSNLKLSGATLSSVQFRSSGGYDEDYDDESYDRNGSDETNGSTDTPDESGNGSSYPWESQDSSTESGDYAPVGPYDSSPFPR